ncbi:hypothetical protein C8Q77DRAFT_1104206 [Trametes polyzona]|nr:hypothetical protein C8Q77DRAFT_1104206 [Trametes polyzona]
MPAVGTAMAVSCPATDSWREGLLGLVENTVVSAASVSASASHDPETTPTATPRAALQGLLLPPGTAEPVRRYGIRADIHYNTEENVVVAMFELPGVKRGDLRITMSVCPFTRVRQVNVAGISRSPLPLQGHGVRERKFGQFVRTLVVPPETKPEDVAVTLEDGILTLKIPGGAPAQAEQPQEIATP